MVHLMSGRDVKEWNDGDEAGNCNGESDDDGDIDGKR